MGWDEVIKYRARKLRSRGRTYSEVCAQLGCRIPKSTLNVWFKDIILPDGYYKRVARMYMRGPTKTALQKARKVNRIALEKRLDAIRNKRKYLIERVDREIGILMLSMLYISEGGKYPARRGMMFGSSDPGMIRLFLVLLRGCYQVVETKFRGVVMCRADQDHRLLETFWSNLSGIPLGQFYPVQVDKRTVGKPTKKKDYKGVFMMQYFDTDLQLELQYLGEYLMEEGPVAQLVAHLDGIEGVESSSLFRSTSKIKEAF